MDMKSSHFARKLCATMLALNGAGVQSIAARLSIKPSVNTVFDYVPVDEESDLSGARIISGWTGQYTKVPSGGVSPTMAACSDYSKSRNFVSKLFPNTHMPHKFKELLTANLLRFLPEYTSIVGTNGPLHAAIENAAVLTGTTSLIETWSNEISTKFTTDNFAYMPSSGIAHETVVYMMTASLQRQMDQMQQKLNDMANTMANLAAGMRTHPQHLQNLHTETEASSTTTPPTTTTPTSTISISHRTRTFTHRHAYTRPYLDASTSLRGDARDLFKWRYHNISRVNKNKKSKLRLLFDIFTLFGANRNVTSAEAKIKNWLRYSSSSNRYNKLTALNLYDGVKRIREGPTRTRTEAITSLHRLVGASARVDSFIQKYLAIN